MYVLLKVPFYASVFSSIVMPYFLSSAINGSLIVESFGHKIPFSKIVPSRTCLTAMPHAHRPALPLQSNPLDRRTCTVLMYAFPCYRPCARSQTCVATSQNLFRHPQIASSSLKLRKEYR